MTGFDLAEISIEEEPIDINLFVDIEYSLTSNSNLYTFPEIKFPGFKTRFLFSLASLLSFMLLLCYYYCYYCLDF